MLSTRLVSLIESHAAEIADRLVAAVKSHPEMTQLRSRPKQEIRDWCLDILQNIGYLLAARKDEEVHRRFEVLGGMRFQQDIPLAEAVLRFFLLKEKILEFIREQGYAMDALQIYAEEELEQRLGRFIDACVYHVVLGYEHARVRTARLAV